LIDIRDRIKDVIKTGGEWISSLDLEDLSAATRRCAKWRWWAWPIRSGASARLPCWWCAKATHRRPSLKEHLKPFVEQGHINKWAIPSQIAIVTEIPKTSVGKLDKKRIRLDIIQWQANNSTFLSTFKCLRACLKRARMLEGLACQMPKISHRSTASTHRAKAASGGMARKSHFRGIKRCACWL
jgi:hypothetical protein